MSGRSDLCEPALTLANGIGGFADEGRTYAAVLDGDLVILSGETCSDQQLNKSDQQLNKSDQQLNKSDQQLNKSPAQQIRSTAQQIKSSTDAIYL